MSSHSKNRNRFRIIAGQWRGRALNFADVEAIRPTSDRVRETLFNWLQNDINGAHCLDVFSGSGALSFEAASRGAASITSLELSKQACSIIQENICQLNCTNMNLVCTDAITWISQKCTTQPFDLVFLDPPFADNRLQECFDLLNNNGWLNQHASIYLESATSLEEIELPKDWTLKKHKKAGQVFYALCERLG